MALTREQKGDQVAWISTVLNDNEVLVVIENKGLSVAQVSDLRSKLREVGAGMKVVKNRLAKIALAKVDGGNDVAPLFVGPTFIGYSEDPVTAPKVLVEWAKKSDKVEIRGGLMAGTALNADGITNLSKMPSREEIIAQIAGSLTAPAANISGAIGAPAANLAACVKTIAEKEDA
ncbi:ribosomal protein L10 [Parvularcula bermudensis HTCC2503]|uniref:Large ribosomal subunit protein uL10 n=1 Tax=Parvularcula bermudensis (strain ATCC BAA-594 / HTCC2503 / KCTC 12087) TaxID=314260 RepID=E0TDA6_PARBH|nr:50S ribosomal protein L10 [Parvularcula bermudensis]ADM09929.1 ribosomal protein L10 [Parvularcula bermudensis HTCC2503]